MRNVKFLFFTLASMLLVIPLHVSAENIYLTNNNGIEISEEDYNNFIKIKPYEYIMTMTDQQYNKLKSLDYSNIQTNTKYIETVYNSRLNITSNKEITEEAFESDVMPILEDRGQYVETTKKRLELGVVGGSYWNFVSLTAAWKGSPAVRSFDVIGLRFDGADVRNGSQWGEQVYSENGKYTTITYVWNGTNIKRFSNGFGISMNVVNNENLQSLVMTIECDITPTKNYTDVYGSYQHAVTNVTLEESHNYELDGGGLGYVFNFPLKISQKYDGMGGIQINY